MRADNVVDCHVLVIGSGGAGVRAAIEAAPYGETILISRTIVGKGGCTTMAEGGYNAVLRQQDSCTLHFEDTLKGGAYLNEPALVRALVEESPDRMADLLAWGAVFDMESPTELAQRPFGGQRFPRTCYAGDRSGHEMMMTLVSRLALTDVTVMQEVTVVELLTDGDRVAGAIALDQNGEMLVIRADSTVIATGGGSRIYDISTNCSSGTGDGYALGYRAGAEVIDMEMVQFHPTGAVYPYDARGRLITEAVRGEGGYLINSMGERFMDSYDPERMELSTRDVVARAIATEVLEARGTTHGGVYLDVTHLPAAQIELRLPVMLEQFLLYGVDIRKDPMEVAPTAHHFMGGLRITPDCQTTVPGLYACGESSGGVQGANRLGGNALAETQVFGRRAGHSAGLALVRKHAIDMAQVEAQEARFDQFRKGTTLPSEVAHRLQKAMWDGAGIFRTAAELLETQEIVADLARIPLRAVSAQNLVECCTVQNMCLTASLVIRGALLRNESRGAHLRKDVEQDWTPKHSPYGHTFLSLAGEGIEKREVPV